MPEQQNTDQLTTQPPVAISKGKTVYDMPSDLYIPPDAMKVFLEAFEGPLDLLLYLIKRQNLDILNIPVAQITAQYIRYIELMKELQLELAGEYLLIATMLAEIKSRMLLPKPMEIDEIPDDPRAELVRRLQEYECYKQAAEQLDALQRYDRDVLGVMIAFDAKNRPQKLPVVSMDSLLNVFAELLARADMYTHHQIQQETLSVRERMTEIIDIVTTANGFVDFENLFTLEEGRTGIVLALLAILELLKTALIKIVQNETNGPIYVQSAT